MKMKAILGYAILALALTQIAPAFLLLPAPAKAIGDPLMYCNGAYCFWYDGAKWVLYQGMGTSPCARHIACPT